MDNFFLLTPLRPAHARLLSLLNRGLGKLRTRHMLVPRPNPLRDMSTAEQRINYFHLLDAVLAYGVPGEVVELGCYTGQCAGLFQQVLQLRGSTKKLHLYDSFETPFLEREPIDELLLRSFAEAGLPAPVLHRGYFEQTLPRELPAQVAFAHIDCGFGGDSLAHQAVLQHCLEALYPRLSPGAVCALMDYHQPPRPGCLDANPGVRPAVEAFLAGKPEQVTELYGNQFAHGFFRKVG